MPERLTFIRKLLPSAGVIGALISVPSAILCTTQLKGVREEAARAERAEKAVEALVKVNQGQLEQMAAIAGFAGKQVETAQDLLAVQKSQLDAGAETAKGIAEIAKETGRSLRPNIYVSEAYLRPIEVGKKLSWKVTLRNAGKPANVRMKKIVWAWHPGLLKFQPTCQDALKEPPIYVGDEYKMTVESPRVFTQSDSDGDRSVAWDYRASVAICYDDPITGETYQTLLCVRSTGGEGDRCEEGNAGR